MKLKNKEAIVTGASKGIGASIATYYAAEGVRVATNQQHLNINIMGAVLSIREAVRSFGDKGGNIINISLVAGKVPMATGSVHSATKAALDAVTIALSKEFSSRNIRINSILPGTVETEGTHTSGVIGSDFEKVLIEHTPLGRMGQPEDIAKVALFLASDDSAWITGEKISVSGGIYGL